jgi:glycosyltransferase involved in cell wall biosynthesis
MSENPLVTVVTVTYNSSSYVKDAIESILSSSYKNFELIIGDDASTDHTWSIIREYKDPRIVAYRNQENLKEYPNRNKAVSLAKGEYLIFIDGDDLIYPHGLEFMVRMLHAFPDCGMALMRWYKKNIFYPVVIKPQQLYAGIYFNYGFNDIAFSNVLFRTRMLLDVGGFPAHIQAGDNYIRFKIGGLYDTLLINDHLTFWRETPGQGSSKIYTKFEALIEHFNLYFDFLDTPVLSKEEKVKAKENINIQVYRVFWELLKLWKVREAIDLLGYYKLSVFKLYLFFKKPLYKDPFENWSAASLFRLPIRQNPFSKSIGI